MHNTTELRFRIHRVAMLHGFRFFKDANHQFVGNGLLSKNTFHSSTSLTRVTSCTGNRDSGCLVQVSITQIIQNNQRVIATQLKRLSLVGTFTGYYFANRHTASKRNDFNIIVQYHLIADVSGHAGYDLKHLRRQPCFVENVGQGDRCEWCQLGRLADHTIVSRNGRCNLVSNHVQGMIERCYCRDSSYRFTLSEYFSIFAMRREITGKYLTIIENS